MFSGTLVNSALHSRGRGMPPRGAGARGGVSRGGPARGGAVRGAPAGRGGPPPVPSRGAAAPRARPPVGGPPQRMGAPPHQLNPAAAAESYDEYVSNKYSQWRFFFFFHLDIESF